MSSTEVKNGEEGEVKRTEGGERPSWRDYFGDLNYFREAKNEEVGEIDELRRRRTRGPRIIPRETPGLGPGGKE